MRVAHTGDLLQIVHTCHLLRGPDLILGESHLVVPLFALGTLVILLKTISSLFIWTLFTESAAHDALCVKPNYFSPLLWSLWFQTYGRMALASF